MAWYVMVSFAVLIFLLVIGVPIPFVFFGVAVFLVIAGGYSPLMLFPYGYQKINGMLFVAFPLFMIAGGVIEKGGIGDHLIKFVSLFLGRLKGGLGVVLTVTCAVFGAISGSSYACENVVGSIMMPRMKEAGYDEGASASLLASACMLGSYIPPSGMMLMYAWLTGQSVLACFLSTIVPGIILILLLSVWFNIKCAKNPNIKVEPKLPLPEKVKVIGKTTWHAIPALLFPVVVLGGIYGGFMTPTEAAAISCVYAIPVALWIYRKATFKEICGIFVKQCTGAGMLGILVFTVSMIGRVYTTENLPGILLALLNRVTDSKALIMLIINLFLIFLGMFMDDGSVMLLTVPVLVPMVQAMGVDPVHFAAVMVINLGMACISPPCAPVLYLASSIGKTSVTKMLRPNFELMFFVWLPMILIVTYIPDLALLLPRVLLGYGG